MRVQGTTIYGAKDVGLRILVTLGLTQRSKHNDGVPRMRCPGWGPVERNRGHRSGEVR